MRLPDVINHSRGKRFTQINNEILRDPDLSLKAKGLLSLLLSNSEGWYSYKQQLLKHTRESEHAIRTALQELEQAGYLRRIRFIDRQTKSIKGSFWSYTDTRNGFHMQDTINWLHEHGYEVYARDIRRTEPDAENPCAENPHKGNHHGENQTLRIPRDKNSKNKEDNFSHGERGEELNGMKRTLPPAPSDETQRADTPRATAARQAGKEKLRQYRPFAARLSRIIRSSKNIKHTTSQINSWAKEVRRLVETHDVSMDRIERALDWYEQHVGEQYVPVVESGRSLREKFVKLEAAMERQAKPATGGSGSRQSRGMYWQQPGQEWRAS